MLSSNIRSLQTTNIVNDTHQASKSESTPDSGKKYYSDGQERYNFFNFSNQLHVDTRGFGAQISDLLNMFSDPDFRKNHPEYRDVFPEECTAIYLQTAQDYSLHSPSSGKDIALYRDVNETLRKSHFSKEANSELDENMKRISPHVKMLTSALNRIIDVAPYKGTAYRGIRGSAEQIEHLYGLYKSNSFYVEPAFMSTTKNKESAQVFEKNTPNNIAFEIIINKGADIKAATQAPSEEEVMLIAGSRFKIDSAMKIENDKHLFKLIQI